MAPNASRLWTPRLTFSHFRAWTHTPSINEYSGPPPSSTGRKRTPTTLDESNARETLETQLAGWEKEIADIEKAFEDGGGQTLKEQLAGLMFSVDVTAQVKKQEYAWDPKGDGARARFALEKLADGRTQSHTHTHIPQPAHTAALASLALRSLAPPTPLVACCQQSSAFTARPSALSHALRRTPLHATLIMRPPL